MKRNIIVVGSLNMDLVVRTPRHPRIGETIIGSGFQTFPGGKGANQAVAAARLGGSVRMIGRVGADDFGKTLLEVADRDGVDTTWIRRDPEANTGVALITVDDDGQNSIVVASGANMRLTAADISAAEAAFEDASVLLLQLEIPLPAIARAIEIGLAHGALIVLNPAPARSLDPAILNRVDYLIPNQNELALISGGDNLQAGVERLLGMGVKHLVVTLGEAGVLVAVDGKLTSLPAYKVKAIDTTAAGDAFVGAFAVALTEGLDATQASAWGIAAGALAVTRAGAQPSLPHQLEFDKFLLRAK